MSITMDSDLSLVPPRRMGRLLAAARSKAGLTLTAAAFATYGRFDVLDLRRVEVGEISVTDDDIRMFTEVYRMAADNFLMKRMELTVDRSEGWLRAGGHRRSFVPEATDRVILTRYLAMVYELRKVPAGRLIVPRQRDLHVLGAVFGAGADEVRLQLEELMRRDRVEIITIQDRLRLRVWRPSIGLMVGFTPIGALLLDAGQEPEHADLDRIPEIRERSA